MRHENFSVKHAFDPELRQQQAELDEYVDSRPIIGEHETAEILDSINTGDSVVKRAGSVALKDSGMITGSFEKPVVEPKRHTRFDRIGMILDDVKDNVDHNTPPCVVTYEGPEAMQFRDKFLSEKAIGAIRRIGMHYPDNSIHRRISHVGDEKAKTFHPHYYFIDRTKPGKTRMYFVDPEHKVASENILRPSIVNLVGVEVPDSQDQPPQLAILRYRVPKYNHQQKPSGLDPNSLRTVIEEVIDRNGELPEVLTGDAERQVLFMLASNGLSSRVQGRYSTKKQMENFARGGKGSSALRGKASVQGHVLNKLIRLFNHPNEARRIK